MYIKRWLEAPIQLEDGKLQYPQGKGTPQGGVISPLLSNLYFALLHRQMDGDTFSNNQDGSICR